MDPTDPMDQIHFFLQVMLAIPVGTMLWVTAIARMNQKAVRDYNAGKYESSLDTCNRALRLGPGLPSTLINRANALNALKRHEEALRDAQKAAWWPGTKFQAYSAILLSYLATAKFDQALIYADKAVAITASVNALINRSSVYSSLGRYADAENDLTAALAQEPYNCRLRRDRGLMRMNQDKFDEAIADFDMAIKTEPALAQAYIYRATALLRTGKEELATADYNEALALKIEPSMLYTEQGSGYILIKNYERAIEYLTRAVELTAQSGALINRGYAYSCLRRFPEAVADCTRALEKSNPADSLLALKVRSLAYADSLQFDKAVADYATIIDQFGGGVDVYLSRAMVYFQSRHLNACICDCAKVNQLYGENSGAYALRAAAKRRTKDYDGALKDSSRAIELDDKSEDCYAVRANVFLCLEKYDQGLADCDKALALDAGCEVAYSNKARILLALERLEEALVCAKGAYELDPYIASIVRTLAHTQLMTNETEQALTTINNSIALDPNDHYSFEVRAKIYEALNKPELAAADLDKAKELDCSVD